MFSETPYTKWIWIFCIQFVIINTLHITVIIIFRYNVIELFCNSCISCKHFPYNFLTFTLCVMKAIFYQQKKTYASFQWCSWCYFVKMFHVSVVTEKCVIHKASKFISLLLYSSINQSISDDEKIETTTLTIMTWILLFART